MAVFTQAKPAGGREILHRALRKRFHRRPAVTMPRGIAQTGTPMPAYRLTRRAAAQAKPLSRAREVGWRYPVLVGGTPCLACLRNSSYGLQYGGMGEGILPQRLFEAAALAVKELDSIEGRFQPRLLEIPALRLFALWLFAPRRASRFIVLVAGYGSSSTLKIESDIAPHLRVALKQMRLGKREMASRKRTVR